MININNQIDLGHLVILIGYGVSFSDALMVAQEFAVSKGLPKSILWEEL
jgi:hypothetical protein